MKEDLNKPSSDGALIITASEEVLEQLLKEPDSFIKGLRIENRRMFYPISDSEAPIEVGVIKNHFLRGYYTLHINNNNIGQRIYDRLRRSY